jgi:hypothetical protein
LLNSLFFSILHFWHFCQKSCWYICMYLYLGLLFYAIGLHVCFCARTMQFLLVWLCGIVWSQVLYYLWHCTICPVLPWIFVVFCISKWILKLIFQSLWWMF